jgi:predicted transposase YdaD
MDAIKDTLDGKVEENDYHDAMIQKIFNTIEKDGITPAERYDMFEEYDRHEIAETELKKGILKEKKLIAKNSLAAGLAIETIVQITGLTLTEIENITDADFDDD